MRAIAHALLGIGALLASACALPLPAVPGKFSYDELGHAPARLRAAAARADITLPPGPSTFGHGHDSRVSDGYWTRLYCRAFYLATPDTKQELVIAACELPAMSALLQRKVAELVNVELARLGRSPLHASRIMLTAVHTHAGFGHYFGAAQYTSIFSSRLPGYDPKLLDVIAGRIAAAIVDAREHAEDAQLAWRHARDFWCFTRNRSLAAYQANRPPFVAEALPECAQAAPELSAIDPALDVLRIDRLPAAPGAEPTPIGSLSFFAMHPTVVSSVNQLFGADVAGVVSRDIERALRQQSCPATGAPCTLPREPLHAVVNTNEGDIAPLWQRGDIDEAIEIGERIAAFILERYPEAAGNPTPVLDARYLEENIRGAKIQDGAQRYQVCGYGQFGLGAARGAPDHPTSVAPLSWFGGDSPADFEATCCQSPKKALLGPVVSAVSRGEGSFPSDLPLAVARIDDTMIAFVPGEMTVTAGHRLKARITAELSPFANAPRSTVLAGLANEYIEYVTTEEEYQLQAYEGASTLYGPSTSRFMTDRLGLLARSMFDGKVADALRAQKLELGEGREMAFAFGPEVSKLPEPSDDARERRTLGTCRMPTARAEQPPRFCMYWQDRELGALDLTNQPGRPWVSVVSTGAAPRALFACEHGQPCDPQPIDDRGYELQTRVHEELDHGWIWSTLFSPRPRTWQLLKAAGARLQVSGSPPIQSSTLAASQPLPVCNVRQARLCTAGLRTTQWEGLVNDE